MSEQENVTNDEALKTAKTEEETKKELQGLNLSSDFLFGNVMSDKEVCKAFLEKTLNFKIAELTYINKQEEFDDLKDNSGVRLDVFAEDSEGIIYNVEMQRKNNDNLFKRALMYQSKIYSKALGKGSGVKYDDLPKIYIIFICMFDFIGEGYYRYDCQMSIRQTETKITEGVNIIFLNTKGKKSSDDLSEDIMAFLKYLIDSSDANAAYLNNEFVNLVHKKVKTVKEIETKVSELKIFGELLDEEREEGIQQGIQQGIEQGKITAALNLIKRRKYSDEEIAEVSELPIEMIAELRNQQ